ncbi:MAG TPA: hypothetical protein VIU41_03250, partial [Geobacteraceae bacterium]
QARKGRAMHPAIIPRTACYVTLAMTLALGDAPAIANGQFATRSPPPAQALPGNVPAIREVPLSSPLPPVVPAPIDLHIIAGSTVAELVDAFLNLLELDVTRDRIVEAGREGERSTYVSIKVDRFFVSQGVPCVIILGERDPFDLSLLQLLEGEGYRVLHLDRRTDFKTIGSTILEHLQWPYTYGRHQLRLAGSDLPREVDGFMLVTGGVRPQQLLITTERLAGER